MAKSRTRRSAGAGAGVDAAGNPVLDPTENVLGLVDAAIRRQDDLRQAESNHVREVSALRADFSAKMASLRAEYQGELRTAEKERIDAIRAVDVGAVQRAAEVQATQASTLAAQVAQSAETLRTQVAAAATAAATALSNALEPIQKSIDDLRRAQYEAQGQKAQVVEGHASVGIWVALAAVTITLVLGVIGVVITVVSSGGP